MVDLVTQGQLVANVIGASYRREHWQVIVWTGPELVRYDRAANVGGGGTVQVYVLLDYGGEHFWSSDNPTML